MKLSKILWPAILASGMFALFCPPKADAASSSAAQFLKLGFGARALGMGESFVAVQDDISNLYYNPAGLAGRGESGREILVSHSWHIQDMGLSQLGFANKRFAASFIYFSAGDLEGRDDAGNLTSNFTAEDYALSAGYGFKLLGLDAGANARVIRQRIKTSAANAVAADFGVMHTFGDSPFKFGASVSNLGTKIKFEDESYPLPLISRVGLSANFKNTLPLIACAGVDFPNDSRGILRLGLEYGGFENLALRAGYKTVSSSNRDAALGRDLGGGSSGVSSFYGFFMGIGFKFRNVNLDYALLPYGELGNSHRFSVGMKF
ncbi:MAG: PorV/PorQ family protein [Elusimicrobia bacterium]|nr:PorV/PorQ family protein [Elusimicrobiota bacterium]